MYNKRTHEFTLTYVDKEEDGTVTHSTTTVINLDTYGIDEIVEAMGAALISASYHPSTVYEHFADYAEERMPSSVEEPYDDLTEAFNNMETYYTTDEKQELASCFTFTPGDTVSYDEDLDTGVTYHGDGTVSFEIEADTNLLERVLGSDYTNEEASAYISDLLEAKFKAEKTEEDIQGAMRAPGRAFIDL